MIAAVVYLIVMFFYIPFHFRSYLLHTAEADDHTLFPHDKVRGMAGSSWDAAARSGAPVGWLAPVPQAVAADSSTCSTLRHSPSPGTPLSPPPFPLVCRVYLWPDVHLLHDLSRLC